MKDPIKALEEYRRFLATIPLDKYREDFKPIKWVEQDLHPLLFPQGSIFENYWEKQNYLDFEEWFKSFWKELNKNEEKIKKFNDLKELVRAHRKFYEDMTDNNLENRVFLGFKARMYRTWISVLTQLDFCYMFEYICASEGKNLILECNAELDVVQGIDARVNEIGFGITKISERKESLKIGRKKDLIAIPYAVYDLKEFERKSVSPRVKNQKGYQKALAAFNKYFISLPNGFVVFKETYLKAIIENIDKIEKVKEVVEKITYELAGES